MFAVPTSVALNDTLSSVAELYVVGRALPLTCTTDAAVNLLPPACTVTDPLPATTLLGVRVVSPGVGGLSAVRPNGECDGSALGRFGSSA